MLLPAGCFVIGMHMQDRRARLDTGDTVGDDFRHRDRQVGMPALAPGTVQGDFQPGLVFRHRGLSFNYVSATPRVRKASSRRWVREPGRSLVTP